MFLGQTIGEPVRLHPPSSRVTPTTFVGTDPFHVIAKSTGCRRSRARPATGSISTATADDQSCRLEAYVIRNDEVIVSRTFGKFACSWFQPRNGTETVGWIETDGDCVAGEHTTTGRTGLARRMARLRRFHSHLEIERGWYAGHQGRGTLVRPEACRALTMPLRSSAC